MNAPLRTIPLTASLLESARDMAAAHDKNGYPGTAIAIRSLVAEVEALREAGTDALVAVNHAYAVASLAQFRASVLLIVAEKIVPVLDSEIEQRPEDLALLQGLSDELHAAIKLAKG